jgi:sortase A
MTTDDATLVAAPAPEPPPPVGSSWGDRLRFLSRGIGQTLITAGVVVLLFIVYEVWVTNWFADRANHRLRHELATEWAKGQDPLALPGSTSATLKTGIGIANLYIPRLGPDFARAIVQGSEIPGDSQLDKGPAHYGGTALPGEVGNFAVAGHRVGKGEPFLNLDKLTSGDPVIVETGTYWYVYRVLGAPSGRNPSQVKASVATASGAVSLPGREIVNPSDGDVVAPVPDHPGVAPKDALMTMTTCNPKFTAENRLIVYAKLTEKVKWTGNAKPAEIEKLYPAGGA